jgi:hypothetical protein
LAALRECGTQSEKKAIGTIGFAERRALCHRQVTNAPTRKALSMLREYNASAAVKQLR